MLLEKGKKARASCTNAPMKKTCSSHPFFTMLKSIFPSPFTQLFLTSHAPFCAVVNRYCLHFPNQEGPAAAQQQRRTKMSSRTTTTTTTAASPMPADALFLKLLVEKAVLMSRSKQCSEDDIMKMCRELMKQHVAIRKMKLDPRQIACCQDTPVRGEAPLTFLIHAQVKGNHSPHPFFHSLPPPNTHTYTHIHVHAHIHMHAHKPAIVMQAVYARDVCNQHLFSNVMNTATGLCLTFLHKNTYSLKTSLFLFFFFVLYLISLSPRPSESLEKKD